MMGKSKYVSCIIWSNEYTKHRLWTVKKDKNSTFMIHFSPLQPNSMISYIIEKLPVTLWWWALECTIKISENKGKNILFNGYSRVYMLEHSMLNCSHVTLETLSMTRMIRLHKCNNFQIFHFLGIVNLF